MQLAYNLKQVQLRDFYVKATIKSNKILNNSLTNGSVLGVLKRSVTE